MWQALFHALTIAVNKLLFMACYNFLFIDLSPPVDCRPLRAHILFNVFRPKVTSKVPDTHLLHVCSMNQYLNSLIIKLNSTVEKVLKDFVIEART